MANPFVGEIRLVPYTFAPSGWAFCNGQLLPIAENDVLFSLIGTTYGGDGQQTFALPNLSSRVVMGGSGVRQIGEIAGTENVTLSVGQLPSHGHGLRGGGTATLLAADSSVPGASARNVYGPVSQVSADTLAPDSILNEGLGQPHNNVQPYLVLNYVISLFGVYPQRN